MSVEPHWHFFLRSNIVDHPFITGKAVLPQGKALGSQVLSLYRERDEVEKKFDDLKNELEVITTGVQRVTNTPTFRSGMK
ncbi:MAG: hypothetical protein QM438_12210 [Euryarchaeota archaeon]|nr:hypothetical protein [Euryarchaeota archaeon]